MEFEEEYEEEMNNGFPNAKFDICMDYESLNITLEPQHKEIILRDSWYIFNGPLTNSITKKYLITSKTFLTYRDVIKQMEQQNIRLMDNGDPVVLEGFHHLKDNVFEVITGT